MERIDERIQSLVTQMAAWQPVRYASIMKAIIRELWSRR